MLLDISDGTTADLVGFAALLIIIPIAFAFGLILFFKSLNRIRKK